MLFLKPTTSYLQNGGTIEVPHPLESLDHEVELAVVIGKKARDVPHATAMDHVAGKQVLNSLSLAGLTWCFNPALYIDSLL